MRAPKFPSFFRNVKTDHRKFRFRSPHFDPKDEELEARKKRIEAEVAQERGESVDEAYREIRFNRKRRQKKRKSGYMAMVRFLAILMVLIYLLYKGIQWAENSDFSRVMKILEDG